MKKFGFILMITTVILIGCGSSTGGSNDATVNTVAVENGDENKDKGDSKPLLLDQESFKKLVMNYEENPKQWVFEGDKPCIVDFYADWCKPCRMIAPILEELAVEYEGQINIYKVDTQKERELASVFGITSLPTVLFVPASGNPSAQKGALPKESYKQIIDEFLLKKENIN